MLVQRRLNYYRRIFAAYLTPGKSQLTFWHEVPEINESARSGALGEYYMTFTAKADYRGHYDQSGVPMLDYHGKLGLQYNPIAIAQYGLANYNLFRRTGDLGRRRRFLRAADWLVANLEKNHAGLPVWHHHFDWEYRTPLKAPWYSALAQGQAISLLVRTHAETGLGIYLETARKGFQPFLKTVDEGGVTFTDGNAQTWFEEYIVSPPTHILNGFIWASWGVHDFSLATGELDAERLFSQAVSTLKANLQQFDVSFWSLYEQSGTRLRMLASPFYHRLHIVQLQVMYRLTGEEIFREFAQRWERYEHDPLKRNRALLQKALFKILYY
jgi:hypothetical protein